MTAGLATAGVAVMAVAALRKPNRGGQPSPSTTVPVPPEDSVEGEGLRRTLEARIRELSELQDWFAEHGVSGAERWYRSRLDEAGAPDAPVPDEERRLRDLARARSEQVWSGIRADKYFKNGDVNWDAVLEEIEDTVRQVARIYGEEHENPLLIAEFGDIALSVRSVASGIMDQVNDLPVVDLLSWNSEQLMSRLKIASQLSSLGDLLSNVRPLVYGAELAMSANPLTAVAQYFLLEIGKSIGKQFGEKYLAAQVETFIWVVHKQAALLYRAERHRTEDWHALAEAVRICITIVGHDGNRRLLMQRILTANIWDEYARLDLLRDLATDSTMRIDAVGVDYESMTPERRYRVAKRVSAYLQGVAGLSEERARCAIKDAEARLKHSIDVDYHGSPRILKDTLLAAFESLAVLALEAGRNNADGAAARIIESRFSKAVVNSDHPVTKGELAKLVEAAVTQAATGGDLETNLAMAPPRGLAATDLADPFFDTAVDLLLGDAGPWPKGLEGRARLICSFVAHDRDSADEMMERFQERCAEALQSAAKYGEPDKPEECAAPRILCEAGEDKILCASAARFANGIDGWALITKSRVVIGRNPASDYVEDGFERLSLAPSEVEFAKEETSVMGAGLVIEHASEAFLLPGGYVQSFEGRFGPILKEIGVDWASLPEVPFKTS